MGQALARACAEAGASLVLVGVADPWKPFPGEAALRATAAVEIVPLDVAGRELRVTCVSMGNPHCVTFVDEITDDLVLRVGREIERHSAFPNRVNAEFRVHGIRRGPHSKHRRATSGWESLTDTELKVAALVEDGLSNPEIAARLMLSRRTVSAHVSHILKKLDVATRAEVARESALRARA